MSRSLDDLVPEFHLKIVSLLQQCSALGFELVPYFTLRDPHTQALLWKQSRLKTEADAEVARLQTLGAPWLATVLRDAPAKPGPWATNALPGNSWHQWGEACDCYLAGPTGPLWADGPGYAAYASQGSGLGLTPGRDFTQRDIDHMQWRSQGAPTDLWSWSEIDKEMKQKFGEKQ